MAKLLAGRWGMSVTAPAIRSFVSLEKSILRGKTVEASRCSAH